MNGRRFATACFRRVLIVAGWWLCAPSAWADLTPSTYGEHLSPELRDAHVVKIPLVFKDDGQVSMIHPGVLVHAGVLSKEHLPPAQRDPEVLASLSLRTATEEEIRRG